MRKVWPEMMAFLLLSSAWLLARAENPDPHYLSPRTSSVARQSAFLHGYLHGYEQGYSTADIDLQMARSIRDPDKIKEGHTVEGYRSEFGSRQSFESGYHQGFRVGYADSIAGRVFRAVDQIQKVMDLPISPAAAAATPPKAPTPPRPWVPHVSALLGMAAPISHAVAPAPQSSRRKDPDPPASAFDQGFAHGYKSGQTRGLIDARSAVPFALPAAPCPAAISKAASAQEACTAYVRGFALGYSDGYVNIAQPATIEAAGSK